VSEVRLGQVRATRMRRIGERHMIVMPAQRAQLLSVDDVSRKIVELRQQRGQLMQRLGPLDALIADLEQQLAAFHALPIDRDEDDPKVPELDRLGALGARARREARPPQHLASVTPVGHGSVPEGATPVPPPELTAADG